jgi:hypothetical protein
VLIVVLIVNLDVVRLGHMVGNRDGVGDLDGHVDGVRLLNRDSIRLGHGDWHLDWHVHGVGLLNGHGVVLLDGVRDLDGDLDLVGLGDDDLVGGGNRIRHLLDHSVGHGVGDVNGHVLGDGVDWHVVGSFDVFAGLKAASVTATVSAAIAAAIAATVAAANAATITGLGSDDSALLCLLVISSQRRARKGYNQLGAKYCKLRSEN